MAKPNPITKDTPDFEVRLNNLVYNQLPIKATEIGWEQIGEQVQELLAAHNQAIEAAVKETLAAICGSCAAWQRDRGYKGCAMHVAQLQTPINQKGGE